MGIEVRHGLYDVCVGNDIMATKEVSHMTVVYDRSCDNKGRVEFSTKM